MDSVIVAARRWVCNQTRMLLTHNRFHGENDPESTPAKGIVTCGAALVHRFFMRRSLSDFDPKVNAGARR